jgi:hypothetical protein
MTRLYRFIGFIVAIGLIGLAAWAIYKGIEKEPSIVGSLATAMAAVLAVVYGQQRQQRLELENEHRLKLEPVYAELIDRLRGAESIETEDPFFSDFIGKLLMSGSDRVIKAWVELQRTPFTEGEVNIKSMLVAEALIKAIRADLGHSGDGLENGDLLRVYIKDIDQNLSQER